MFKGLALPHPSHLCLRLLMCKMGILKRLSPRDLVSLNEGTSLCCSHKCLEAASPMRGSMLVSESEM